MSKIESFIVGTILFFAVPACLFFPAWWMSFLLLPEKAIPIAALSGLFVGILLDLVFLNRWVKQVYFLNILPLTAAYLLISLICFAVCMGVPVFHPLLGIIAGAYVGRKLHHMRADDIQMQNAIKYTAIFTTAVIGLICVFSATIALLNPSTPSELQRMFNLTFTVNWWMVFGLIIIGGFMLNAFQYWSTKKAIDIFFHLGDKIVKQI